MRVILFCQRDAVMSEQFADHRYVHTLLREMRSERVSQDVNAGSFKSTPRIPVDIRELEEKHLLAPKTGICIQHDELGLQR